MTEAPLADDEQYPFDHAEMAAFLQGAAEDMDDLILTAGGRDIRIGSDDAFDVITLLAQRYGIDLK